MSSTPSRFNAMTIDVEDYFQVSAFESVISESDWGDLTFRAAENTHRILDFLAEHDTKATFFTLGWVAQKAPDVIKRIVSEGHELASHGLAHRRATTMTPDELAEDIRTSKAILEDVGGTSIIGYRAPSFSFNDNNRWAYDILADLGFKYSSSTYPISHDLYGVPHWPRFKHLGPNNIIEIPIPTINASGKNKGIGGGGYFRLYPYWYSKRLIDQYMAQESEPYSFYFHPWEIDPAQPRIKGAPLKSRIRHYINLSKMEPKVIRLLKDYNWTTMQHAYGIE